MSSHDVADKVKEFISSKILGGSGTSELTNATRLISGGIMDSISTIQLVDFLEKEFSVQFKPHEVDQDNLDTIDLIVKCVEQKMKA